MDREFRVFTMDGRSGTVMAANAQAAYDAVRASTPDAGDRGVIIRDPEEGTESYVSSGFATSDPERINQIRGSAMTPGQASQRSIMESVVSQDPVGARAASAIQGVPFIGEYADELAGATMGDAAQDYRRLAARSMQETRPVESALTQLGVGIGATLPAAAATLPASGMSVGRAALQGGLLGSALGTAEGAVSGYGAGENEAARRQSSIQRAGTGALFGGVLGGAAPVVGAGLGAAAGATIGQRPMNQIAEALGISPSAARVAGGFREFEQGAGAIPTPTVPRSLAETSPEMRGLLDLGMSVPGAGRSEAAAIIGDQATDASRQLMQTLDDTLGVPSGVRLQQRDLMSDTAEERSNLYQQAYSQPIDYSTAEGDRLLNLVERVDPSVIENANVLMRREGLASNQIRVNMDENGNITGVDTLPDVMQLDYITRALQSRARTMGASPEDVTTLTRQVRDIRNTVDELVPDYAAARSRAAEVIGERESLELGQDILSGKMRREDVQLGLEGLTPGELNNVKSGMRQYIDDVMARVSSPLNPEGEEAKEAVRALRQLTSREARDKIGLVLGEEAAPFLERLSNAVEPLAIRSVGGGSQTAPRQFGMEQLAEEAQMGLLDRLGSGQTGLIAEAARFAGSGGPQAREVTTGIANELAPFVARQRAPESLDALRMMLDQVGQAGQRPTQMLRGGTDIGYLLGLGSVPAAGGAGRETGLAPRDVRRITPR